MNYKNYKLLLSALFCTAISSKIFCPNNKNHDELVNGGSNRVQQDFSKKDEEESWLNKFFSTGKINDPAKGQDNEPDKDIIFNLDDFFSDKKKKSSTCEEEDTSEEEWLNKIEDLQDFVQPPITKNKSTQTKSHPQSKEESTQYKTQPKVPSTSPKEILQKMHDNGKITTQQKWQIEQKLQKGENKIKRKESDKRGIITNKECYEREEIEYKHNRFFESKKIDALIGQNTFKENFEKVKGSFNKVVGILKCHEKDFEQYAPTHEEIPGATVTGKLFRTVRAPTGYNALSSEIIKLFIENINSQFSIDGQQEMIQKLALNFLKETANNIKNAGPSFVCAVSYVSQITAQIILLTVIEYCAKGGDDIESHFFASTKKIHCYLNEHNNPSIHCPCIDEAVTAAHCLARRFFIENLKNNSELKDLLSSSFLTDESENPLCDFVNKIPQQKRNFVINRLGEKELAVLPTEQLISEIYRIPSHKREFILKLMQRLVIFCNVAVALFMGADLELENNDDYTRLNSSMVVFRYFILFSAIEFVIFAPFLVWKYKYNKDHKLLLQKLINSICEEKLLSGRAKFTQEGPFKEALSSFTQPGSLSRGPSFRRKQSSFTQEEPFPRNGSVRKNK